MRKKRLFAKKKKLYFTYLDAAIRYATQKDNIDDLRNKLNSFNTDTAEEEIKQLKDEVSSLEKSTSGVEKVGNVFQSLAKSTLVVSAVHQGITALKNSIRDGNNVPINR